MVSGEGTLDVHGNHQWRHCRRRGYCTTIECVGDSQRSLAVAFVMALGLLLHRRSGFGLDSLVGEKIFPAGAASAVGHRRVARFLSLSTSGGEGWGEEASCSRRSSGYSAGPG